ncbi:MAG: hypothetical protein V2I65_01940 [Paracoccaceae bacterium]|jgi:hypothetical protein|nr:hypothetical protein [Paracoccaceae bacterium]
MRDHRASGRAGVNDACTAPAGGGQLVVLPRAGKPPLRLRAELLCRVDAAARGEDGLEGIAIDAGDRPARLEIWRRPAGGVLASLTGVPGARAETLTADSLDTLLADLESRVRPLSPARDPGRVAGRDPGRAIAAAEALGILTGRLVQERARGAVLDLLERTLAKLEMAGVVAQAHAPAADGARAWSQPHGPGQPPREERQDR